MCTIVPLKSEAKKIWTCMFGCGWASYNFLILYHIFPNYMVGKFFYQFFIQFWKNYVLHRDFDLKILLRYFLTRWKKNRISSFLANLLQKFLLLINVAQFFSSQILYVVHFLVDCKEPLTHICKERVYTVFTVEWNLKKIFNKKT